MTKVWVVSKGEYSDYRIMGVYSTKERAEEGTQFWEAARIEEFDVDVYPEHPKGLYPYCVEMEKDGNVVSTFHCEYNILAAYPWKKPPSVESWRFSVWARDENHAIKIANERRIQLIAENLWLPRSYHYPDPEQDRRDERIRKLWPPHKWTE